MFEIYERGEWHPVVSVWEDLTRMRRGLARTVLGFPVSVPLISAQYVHSYESGVIELDRSDWLAGCRIASFAVSLFRTFSYIKNRRAFNNTNPTYIGLWLMTGLTFSTAGLLPSIFTILKPALPPLLDVEFAHTLSGLGCLFGHWPIALRDFPYDAQLNGWRRWIKYHRFFPSLKLVAIDVTGMLIHVGLRAIRTAGEGERCAEFDTGVRLCYPPSTGPSAGDAEPLISGFTALVLTGIVALGIGYLFRKKAAMIWHQQYGGADVVEKLRLKDYPHKIRVGNHTLTITPVGIPAHPVLCSLGAQHAQNKVYELAGNTNLFEIIDQIKEVKGPICVRHVRTDKFYSLRLEGVPG